jgi:hypothetical protein
MGYATSALPIAAYFRKMEQGFETAANYDAKDFPTELWDHPDVQAYIQKRAAYRRVKFNLWRDFLLNPAFEAFGNVTVTPTSTHGTRGWLRALLPGDRLPEEYIIDGTRGLVESTKDIPGVNKLASGLNNACEKLLDASYSEWTHLRK